MIKSYYASCQESLNSENRRISDECTRRVKCCTQSNRFADFGIAMQKLYLKKKKKTPPSYKTFVSCKACGVSLCLTKDSTCFYEMAFNTEGAHVKCCVVAKTQ